MPLPLRSAVRTMSRNAQTKVSSSPVRSGRRRSRSGATARGLYSAGGGFGSAATRPVRSSAALQLGHPGDPEVWLGGAQAGALVFIWFGVRQFERGVTKPKDDTGPMTLTVTGLSVENEDFVARHAWRSFKVVDETPAHVVIRTKQSGVFIVPRRDFAAPAHVATFVSALRAGIARNGGTVA